MITHHQLKDLASNMSEDDFFVSLYLNVDPNENRKDEWMTHFKNLSKDALANFSSNNQSSIESELSQIEKFISDRPDGMKRGLCIISCKAMEFWNVFHTALPFSNQLVIEHDPYIKPLATMLDIYQIYLVPVVGKTKARVLITGQGEINELTSISIESTEIDSGKDGSKGDYGTLRAQKMEEKVKRLVHKDAMKIVEKIVNEEEIERILVGGTDRGRAHFKELLPIPLKKKVVGEFSVDRNGTDSEILEKLLPVMRDIEFKFERKALDELFNQNEKSVFGLSDVLTALQQGNVHKMYVLSHVTSPGMICEQCGALTPDRENPCPYCEGPMKTVQYMLDYAIQKAFDQGARVDMLDHAPRLEKFGGIGALLRY